MELKAKGVDDVYLEYFNTGKHDLAQVYLKTEVDRFIEDIVEKAIHMIKNVDRCIGMDKTSPLGKIADAALKQHFKAESDKQLIKDLKTNCNRYKFEADQMQAQNQRLQEEISVLKMSRKKK